jgi:hypothetical protein
MYSLKNHYLQNHQANVCVDDIYCKNKSCKKLHVERKRQHICQFDIFFIPDKDRGCHFNDCTFFHPRRDHCEMMKEDALEKVATSVAETVLYEPTSKSEKEDVNEALKKLLTNLYSYHEFEDDLNQKLSQSEEILHQSQEYYTCTTIRIQSEYHLFMSKFNEFVSQFEGLCQRINVNCVRFASLYPKSKGKIYTSVERLKKTYQQMDYISKFVINEYQNTFHVYPLM